MHPRNEIGGKFWIKWLKVITKYSIEAYLANYITILVLKSMPTEE
jgi:hypothetical protein